MTDHEARDLGAARGVTDEMRASWNRAESRRRRVLVLRAVIWALLGTFVAAMAAAVFGG